MAYLRRRSHYPCRLFPTISAISAAILLLFVFISFLAPSPMDGDHIHRTRVPIIFRERSISNIAGVNGGPSIFRVPDKGGVPGHDLWSTKNARFFYACSNSTSKFPKAVDVTRPNRYLAIATSGGLNQQRTGITDAVVAARILNATLVVPKLDQKSFWKDVSNFSEIFDVDWFISYLEKDVKVVKELPRRRGRTWNPYTMRVPRKCNEHCYISRLVPVLSKKRAVMLTKFDYRLANRLDLDLQKLRCRVNYHALKFTNPILEMGAKLVQRMRMRSKHYIALHLRFEPDMLAFSGCYYGGGEKEIRDLTKIRQRWKTLHNPNPERERRQGRCPLTPQEVGLLVAIGKKRFEDNGNTWSATLMGRSFYNTIDPENVKAVLATQFQDFGLGQRLESFGPLLGQGIFTTDGKQWEHSRALVRPNFTRAQVADLDTFETHIQQFISKIPRDGQTVDLQALFFKLTLDSATEFLFGDSVNSLNSSEDSEQDKFGRLFDLAQGRLGNRSRLGRLAALYRDSEFDEACKFVHQFVDKIIFKALEKAHPRDPEKSIESKSDRYVFLTEMLKSTRDPKQLRDELLNILLAGRDTTASLLSNTFHVLARRPDIWKKLKAEVDELQGVKPDYETLRNMKYLKNLLNESLRLYPVVPGNARFANRDTTIPRGGGPNGEAPVFIPKGAIVAYSVFAMHRRKDIYGPDAEQFNPDRWDEGLRPGWAYLPFNGGPRICVGQIFALTEASYTTVRLLQEFGGIEDRDGTPWEESLSLTVASAKGVNVVLTPR